MKSETIDEMADNIFSNYHKIYTTGPIHPYREMAHRVAKAGYLAGLEAAAKVVDPDEYMSVRDYETAEQIAAAIRKMKGE